MFDAPTKTKVQRRAATQFRQLLLDCGFTMLQFSVYARYGPSSTGIHRTVAAIKHHLPPDSRVCIVMISDHQWAQAIRIRNETDPHTLETAEQLTIF